MRKWLNRFSPLGWRIVAATVVFSTLVAVLSTAVQLYFAYRSDLDEISSTLEQIKESNLPTISNALWATNHSEVQVAINGLVRLPNVRYVEVREKSMLWAAAGVPKFESTRTREYGLSQIHRGELRSIGMMRVVIDMDGVYQRLWDKLLVILVSNGVKTFFVAGFMLLIFHLMVTRHLHEVARYASHLGTDNLNVSLSLSRNRSANASHDEFDLVQAGFHRMQTSLLTSMNALKESEERFRTVADFTHDWEYWLAPDGSLPYVSPSCERFTGYTATEFQQNPGLLKSILHPEDRNQVSEYLDKIELINAEGSREFDFRIIKRDGTVRWIAHVDQAVYGQTGGYRGRRASNRDITDRKIVEAEINRLNAELENRVMERTAQLVAVNEELEAFSYSVSHDLRTPLRSIDGFSQALAEDYGNRLDGVGHDYLNRVRRAAQRMGMLIDDLLRLARVTRADMKLIHIDISALTQEIMTETHRSRKYRESPYSIQGNLVAKGDPVLLRIVMENLLDNACKYSSKIEQPLVEVGSLMENGRTVYFVRDNGAGFDMAFVGKLFGAFQRLHRAEDFPGTGVGLATVKRIVHRHGGEIWAEGQPGKGAIFKFTLSEY